MTPFTPSTGATVTKQFFSHGVRVGTADYYYTKDHLGSIREVTNDQGALQARYDYDPYGRLEETSGTFNSDFLFTGHFYHVKSGLHLAPYRAYDADLARWLSRDPLEWAELLPEGPNVYRYVGGNSINYVDFSGRFMGLGDLAIVVGIIIVGTGVLVGASPVIIIGGVALIVAGLIRTVENMCEANPTDKKKEKGLRKKLGEGRSCSPWEQLREWERNGGDEDVAAPNTY